MKDLMIVAKKQKTISIKQDEHVFICGMTGSGKSQLAEIYLAGENFPHVVMLDTKGQVYERRKKRQPIWRGLEEKEDFTVVEHLKDLGTVETDKIVYAPHFQEQDLDHYNSLLKWIYQRENTTLWVDEMMEVSPSAHKYPEYIKALYTRGRSKDVGVWACAQRTLDIPAIILANTTHFFVFDLNQPQDRKKMADSTGVPEFQIKPSTVGGKYSFWYFNYKMDKPQIAKLQL
jgi:energy-coupling factor transporter ATP-binding protein EcfA2